jgi:hypothetical protein
MAIKIKEIKDVKEFTIKRSKWARGGINGKSALLNNQGNMCCLGHYAKACGFSNNDIDSLSGPVDLYRDKSCSIGKAWSANYIGNNLEIIAWKTKLLENDVSLDGVIYKLNSGNAWDLMEINDRDRCEFDNESDREKELIKRFKKIGIKVKFVD